MTDLSRVDDNFKRYHRELTGPLRILAGFFRSLNLDFVEEYRIPIQTGIDASGRNSIVFDTTFDFPEHLLQDLTSYSNKGSGYMADMMKYHYDLLFRELSYELLEHLRLNDRQQLMVCLPFSVNIHQNYSNGGSYRTSFRPLITERHIQTYDRFSIDDRYYEHQYPLGYHPSKKY